MSIRATLIAALFLSSLAPNAHAARPKLSPPSSWPPAVRKAYEAVLAAPAPKTGKSQEVMKAVLALVKTGAAHDALGTLAFDDSLPEAHRALSGIWLAKYHQFDPAVLLGFVEDPNPFLMRQAIDELAEIGGKEIGDSLKALGAKNVRIAVAVKPRLSALAPNGKPAHILKALDTLLRGKGKQKKRTMAAVALSQSKEEAAEWGLVKMLRLPWILVLDKDGEIDAALALTRMHAKDVPGLIKLTDRSNNKIVRHEAINLLAKTPEGKKALRDLKLTVE
jgi:hypothetical protein